MPRPDKGPRLYLKRLKGRTPMWVIRDRGKEISTGCAYPDPKGVRFTKLKDYTTRTFRPDTGQLDLNKVACSAVLMLYFNDMPEDSPTKKTTQYHVANLQRFWGEKSLSDVKGSSCREYVNLRSNKCSPQVRSVKPSTSRQELKTFQAAINHWHKESPLIAVPKVTLPKPGERRERVLERNEVAAMLWACRRLSREEHVMGNMGKLKFDYSHVARFILIGLYTGTRHDRLLRLRWDKTDTSGYIDAERRVIHRAGGTEKKSSKRSPPVQIPGPLGRFFALWGRNDGKRRNPLAGPVIHHKGRRILKMKKAWATVLKEASTKLPSLGYWVHFEGGNKVFLTDVVPHTLRHSCATYHLRDGKTAWDVGGVIGADEKTVDRVYGHHSLEQNVRGFMPAYQFLMKMRGIRYHNRTAEVIEWSERRDLNPGPLSPQNRNGR